MRGPNGFFGFAGGRGRFGADREGGFDPEARLARIEERIARLEEIRERIETRAEVLRELNAIDGDADDEIEYADLTASEDFTITEDAETGNAIITTPFKTLTTNIAFADTGDDFEALAAVLDSILIATKELNDSATLEPADLDAAPEFFITESEDGDVVVNGPLGAKEMRIDFVEGETDSFAGIAEVRHDKIPYTGLFRAIEEDDGGVDLGFLF